MRNGEADAWDLWIMSLLSDGQWHDIEFWVADGKVTVHVDHHKVIPPPDAVACLLAR